MLFLYLVLMEVGGSQVMLRTDSEKDFLVPYISVVCPRLVSPRAGLGLGWRLCLSDRSF
jgi:hypothetical protein